MKNLIISNLKNEIFAFGNSKSGKSFGFPNVTLASAKRISQLSYKTREYTTRLILMNHGQTAISIEKKWQGE